MKTIEFKEDKQMKKNLMTIVTMAMLPAIIAVVVFAMALGSAFVEGTVGSLWMRTDAMNQLMWIMLYVVWGSLMVNFLNRN